MEALGPPAFTFCGKRFTRTDFTLRTKRGFNLECSHWEPVERVTDRIPVVIYMHGNSSARVEVLPQLSYLLSLGVAVFSFDFAGSGKSDGEYVSLGYYEREDLSCVVAHLRATNVVSTVALWGRSMGAATALMFGDRDPSIACMILDSPFADLTQLAEEMVEKGRDQGILVPNFVVSVALRMIAGSVKKQANVNIKNISPIAHADKCFIPALLVAGEHDDFIKKRHAEAIYEKYAGDKNIIIVEGDHNSPRPKFMFDSASIFLQTCLQIPNSWALPVPPSMNLMCPPWYFEMYQNRTMRSPLGRNGVVPNGSSGKTGNGQQAPSRSTNGTKPSKDPSGCGSGKAGFEGDQMGMTQDRQREIQASLFKMLGQADDPMVEAKDETNISSRSKPPPSRPAPAQQAPQPPSSKPPSSGKMEVVTGIPFDEAG
jgi:pimeloyl-ACP methyl ester carboxylesterase